MTMDFDSLPWTGVETQYNELPLLIRFVRLPRTFPKSKYPQRINVFWKMAETSENGLPTEDELMKLETFENRLCDAVHPDRHSILVGALTCNGEKEFIFHTSDVPGFLQRLTNMPQEKERYPITIQRYDDPNWTYLKSVVSNSTSS